MQKKNGKTTPPGKAALRHGFQVQMLALGLPTGRVNNLFRAYWSVAQWLAAASHQHFAPLTVGICGPIGAGKTTLTSLLAWLLESGFGLRVARVHLDDLYLTRPQRQELAQTVHPLLATRGMPGTHDTVLGRQLCRDLISSTGQATAIPVFEKALDDRLPRSKWRHFQGPADLLLFEGWCVGVPPEHETMLATPVNAWEREQDPDGCWRQYVNEQLAGPYKAWFACLNRLIGIAVPQFEAVAAWRWKQEQQLAKNHGLSQAQGVMNAAQVATFVCQFERLTRHMQSLLEQHCDWLIQLDQNQWITQSASCKKTLNDQQKATSDYVSGIQD